MRERNPVVSFNQIIEEKEEDGEKTKTKTDILAKK